MKIQKLATLSLAVFAVALMGCGKGDSNSDISASANQEMDAMSHALKESGGDWSKVSEADKKAILARYQGNEDAAKQALQAAATMPKPGAGLGQ